MFMQLPHFLFVAIGPTIRLLSLAIRSSSHRSHHVTRQHRAHRCDSLWLLVRMRLPETMADDKGSPKLKDLAFLKDQLEGLQRRVENEVHAGINQESTFLSSPFLKGFLAGYVVSKLRASAVLGFAVGTCTGIYAAQAYAVPNVEKTIKDYFSSFKRGSD